MQNHWSGYITALNQNSHPSTTMPNVAPYETSSSQTGKTGFMDLLVNANRQTIQAKYDAMQGTWEGPEAADKAVSKGLFKAESMPVGEKFGKK